MVDRVLFVDMDESTAEPTASTAPPTPPRITYMDFSFLTLEDMVRERRIPPDAMLNIMTLRKFKDAIEDEWPKYAEKIHRTAENVISQRMGQGDSVAKESDDTYIFCFYSLHSLDARQKAEAITHDLMTVLVGDRFQGVQLAVGETTLEKVLDDEGAIDAEKVAATIAAAVAVPWPDEMALPREGRGDWQPPSDLEMVDDGDVEERPRDQDSGAEAAIQASWTPLVWPPRDERRRRPVDLPPDSLDYHLPEGIKLGYRPVWDARREVLDTYVAYALTSDAGGQRRDFAASGTDVTACDFALLLATLEQIQRNIEERHRLHMVAPLHFDSLILPGLATVKAILRHFPDAARARHLIIEITDLPRSPRPADLATLRRLLGALCRDTIVRLGVHGPSRSAIETLGPGAISLHGPVGQSVGRPDTGRSAFASRVCFWGIDNRSMLAQAMNTQPWLIGGEAIGSTVMKPRDIEFLPRRAVLADTLAV